MSVSKGNDEFPYDKYWIPKKLNYEYTSEHCASKTLTKNLPHLYNPGDNISHRNAFTYCELTKKKLYDVEKIHAHTLENAKKKREDLNKQWAELENKETEFRNRFLYFETFVKANETKRLRAKLKLEEMVRLISKRNDGVNNFERQIQEYQLAKIEMDNAIAKMSAFENYLNSTREKYLHTFRIPIDIIKRYSSLLEARACVGMHYENSLRELENCKKKSEQLVGDYQIKIDGLRTMLAELNRRYDVSKANSEKWELILNEVTLEAMDKLMETIAVKDTCWKIYKDMCERKNLPAVHKDDYGKQFDFIKKMLYQFDILNQKIRDLEQEKLKMSEKACLSSDVNVTQ